MPEAVRWKRAFRFSLGSLMFVTLCVCGYFGGDRSGQLAGAQDRYDQSHFVRVYGLSDLLVDEPTPEAREHVLEEVTEHLKSTVAPDTWTSSDDGDGGIEAFPAAGSLIIAQRGAVHDQIDRALSKFRDQRTQKSMDEALQAFESLVRNERRVPLVLSSPAAKESLALAAIEQRFENTVRRLESRWGNPKFNGKCTERGFPPWSVAQSMAMWNIRDGIAYVALQDWPDAGLSLVAGWRPGD